MKKTSKKKASRRRPVRRRPPSLADKLDQLELRVHALEDKR